MDAPLRSTGGHAAPDSGQIRDLLRAVIDNLPDSIFAKDRDGRFIMANAAVACLMGRRSPDEILGRTDEELVSADLADFYREIDRGVMERGEPLLDHEEFSLDATGKVRWDLTTKVPLRDASGEICGLVAISREITAQKLADERLRETLMELRETQAQLIEVEKSRSVGRLAMGIAHEIKNPLAVALMGVDFLGQETFAADSAAPAVLAEMRTALQRADSIVREVMAFSEPKALSLGRHNLDTLLDESLARVAPPAQVVIERERGCGVPDLPLDREKIGRVFDILLKNAVGAMQGAVRLSVRTCVGQLTGVGANVAGTRAATFRVGEQIASVHIEDNGPGIPADQIDRVFEPFFTTAPTGQGTGLGLTVARAIIDLHGGAIRLHNRPSGGLSVELMFRVA